MRAQGDSTFHYKNVTVFSVEILPKHENLKLENKRENIFNEIFFVLILKYTKFPCVYMLFLFFYVYAKRHKTELKVA